jgi:hypothetical protein
VESCPSRCSVRAFMTMRCTRYAIRRRFDSHPFLVAFSLPLPLSPFAPSTRVWADERMHGREPCTLPTWRGVPIQVPDDVHPSLQPHRGHPVRTDNLPRHRHLCSFSRRRSRTRPRTT